MKVVPVKGGDRDIIVAMAPGYHDLSFTGIEGFLPLSAIGSQRTVW